MNTTDQIAAEKAKDFCEKQGLREHFIEQDLTRAIKAAIDKALHQQAGETTARGLSAVLDEVKPDAAHASEPLTEAQIIEGYSAQ